MNFESKVRLYQDVPLSLGNNHTLYFSNSVEKETYFNSKQVMTYENMSYIRMDSNQLQVGLAFKDVINTNYLSFKNTSDTTEYYAFITDVKYIADDTTLISFSIDPFVTYFDKVNVLGHIEREHADYSKLNTIPEDIGTGDYVQTKGTVLTNHTADVPRFAIVTTTVLLDQPEGYSGGTDALFNHGVQQPYNYYIIPAGGLYNVKFEDKILADISQFTQIYANSPELVNKIVSMQVVDTIPIPHSISKHEIGENQYEYSIGGVGSNMFLTNISLFGNLIGININKLYTNNYSITTGLSNTLDSSKLNNYPYSLIELTNGRQNIQFKPELFSSSQIAINETRSLENDIQVAYTVNNYADELGQNNRLTIPASLKLPIISTELAAYLQSRDNAYLTTAFTQVATGIGLIALSGATGGAGAAAAGLLGASQIAGVSSITSGVGNAIGSTIDRYKSVDKAKRSPNNVIGNEGTLINMNLNTQVYLITKQQTPEYRKIIGDYFKMYGWRVLRYGSPNIKTRKAFNYVKMNEVVIKGVVPQFAKEQITNMLLNGMTFWHSKNVGDYSLDNSKG